MRKAWGAVMKLVSAICIMLLGAAVGGCAGIDRAQQTAALQEQSQAMTKECQRQFPGGDSKTAVARVQCLNDALAILMPAFGSDADLARALMAYRISVAQQFARGEISKDQANTMINARWAQLSAEQNQRNAARTAAADQAVSDYWSQVFVNYAALQAASQPVRLQTTCTRLGNMTTCY